MAVSPVLECDSYCLVKNPCSTMLPVQRGLYSFVMGGGPLRLSNLSLLLLGKGTKTQRG